MLVCILTGSVFSGPGIAHLFISLQVSLYGKRAYLTLGQCSVGPAGRDVHPDLGITVSITGSIEYPYLNSYYISTDRAARLCKPAPYCIGSGTKLSLFWVW